MESVILRERSDRRIFFVVVCVLLSFLGCSRTPQSNPYDGHRVLRLALSEDLTTLDPALITDVAGGAVSAKIFDGLVRFDADGNVRPCLAQSWEVQENGREYVFNLRENVRFHNGRRVTAEDVRKSFERILDPALNCPRRWVLEKIKGARDFRGQKISGPLAGITVVNDRTLRIELESPCALFLSLLAMPNAAIVPLEEVERWGPAFGQHPVGTGPFRLERWDRDKTLILKKNPQYFDGEPLVEGVEYRIIPEAWSAWTEFSRGKLDWVAVGPGQIDQLAADPLWAGRLKSRTGLNTYYLGFNCSKPPLDRPRVRKALAMAVDRKKIVEKLMKLRAVSAAGPVPPVLDSALADLPAVPYDPALARQWLREEGVGALRLSLYQVSSQDALEVMEVVQDYLGRIGVEVHIVQHEWSSFKQEVARGEPDMFFLSWWADYPDAENFLAPNFFSGNFGIGGNKSRFSDPVFDRLILEAGRETNSPRRVQLYRQCVERLSDLSPWMTLWHRTDWIALQPWVHGFELGLVYNSDKFNTIRLEEPRKP